MSEIFKKTTGTASPEQVQSIDKYERVTVSLDKETSIMFDDFVHKIKRETGFKISKSIIVKELIKLIPALNLNPFYMASQDDVKNQFEIIKKKLNQLA